MYSLRPDTKLYSLLIAGNSMINPAKTIDINRLREKWVNLFTVQKSGLLHVQLGTSWLLAYQVYRILEITSFQYNIQNLKYFCAFYPNNTHRTIILPTVLYGCETWSLKLSEKIRLELFGNRVLGGILRAMGDEVTGEWIKIHNEELNDLYCSTNVVQVVKYLGLRGTR